MKKEAILVILLLVFSTSVYAKELQADPGITPDNVFYFTDTFVDDIRLELASEEEKVLIATEIHDERIAEAQVLIEQEEVSEEHVEEAFSEAQESIAVIQEEITPEVYEEVQDFTKNSIEVLTELKEQVPEAALPGIENAINNQIVEEEKTKIVAEITSKIDSLCLELINLVGLEQAIIEEPRCNPDIADSPKWLKRKATGEYKELDEEARKKFLEEMSICFNDPRECRCEEIPIKSFSNTCFEIIPNVIKCQFEQDQEACDAVNRIGEESQDIFEELPLDLIAELDALMRTKYQENFEEHAPKECVDANALTVEECEKIFLEKYLPEECKLANAYSREACEKIMQEKYQAYNDQNIIEYAPEECIENGEFIGFEECSVKFEGQGFEQNYVPQSYTSEIPQGVIFKDGQAEIITNEEFNEIITYSEEYVYEYNIDEVKNEVYTDLEHLETGVEVLEQSSSYEAANAIQETYEESSEQSYTSESSSGSSESSSESSTSESSGGEQSSEVSGQVVLDTLKLIEKLKK